MICQLFFHFKNSLYIYMIVLNQSKYLKYIIHHLYHQRMEQYSYQLFFEKSIKIINVNFNFSFSFENKNYENISTTLGSLLPSY